MNPIAQFERELEQWLQAEAPASAPAGFHASVMDRARTLRQRPGWATSLPVRRLGRGRGMTLFAAAALLLVGGALAAGSGLLRLPSIVPPAPAPSLAVFPTASTDARTTPSPSASPSPSPTPLSLDLTWTQVPLDEQTPRLAWIGDRFVLADVESGAVRTSVDGRDWQELPPGDATQGYVDLVRGSVATWQDSAVGWWNPQDHEGPETAGGPPITARDAVVMARASAPPTSTTPFKGRIESLGMGPKGIVAQVHSDLDWDAWVTKKLGLKTNNDWTCCVEDVSFQDGVLQIKLRNRPGLKVVWADEGLEPGDYQDRGFGWFSPDGAQWTEMAPNDRPTGDFGSSLPTGGFGSVVGVSDGFIATGSYPDGTCADPDGSCTGMWYSSDGLDWRFLGTTAPIRESGRELCIRDACSTLPGQLLPWRDGALAIDGDGRLAYWTSDGSTELPFTALAHGPVATGALGLVSISGGEVLVSRDGVDHKVSSIPEGMADPPNGGAGSTVIAVGDRTVLVLESRGSYEPPFASTYSAWLGTFEP